VTAIVGVLCRDGVVVGTDGATTFGGGRLRTIEQPTEKLTIVDGSVIVAATGSAGQAQRFNALIRQACDQQLFDQANAIFAGKTISRAIIEDLQSTYCQLGQLGALVGLPLQGQARLCEFGLADLQPEWKDERIWYCSMGSTQSITDSFLALMREVYWSEGQPSLQDGVFAVLWTLQHAVAVNPGGVNLPIRIAVLERAPSGELRARMLRNGELQEHRQNIGEAKRKLQELRQLHRSVDSAPDAPRLE